MDMTVNFDGTGSTVEDIAVYMGLAERTIRDRIRKMKGEDTPDKGKVILREKTDGKNYQKRRRWRTGYIYIYPVGLTSSSRGRGVILPLPPYGMSIRLKSPPKKTKNEVRRRKRGVMGES